MELHDLTIGEASRRIKTGDVQPEALAQTLLARIKRLDPSLEAWAKVDEDQVLSAAKAAGDEIKRKGPRGPLHGIPIGLKDIIYTKGMVTAAGAKQFANFVPTYDATSVTRLKDAGAVILGKCVTAAFGDGDMSTIRGDFPFNPWDRERNAGGSSNGSSVAVAARMVPGALGSQTGGSVLKPAAYNGIVGFKPSYGRISRYGVLPQVWTVDTVGVLVRSVEDAALLLGVLAGHDAMDPCSAWEPVDDYAAAVHETKRPPRIGLIREYFYDESTEEVRRHTDALVDRFKQAGAIVQEVKLPESFHLNTFAQRVIINVEAASTHRNMYFKDPNSFPPSMRRSVENGLLIPAVNYVDAQRLRRQFRADMALIMQSHDILLTPTLIDIAPKERLTIGNGPLQSAWTSCGLPAISVPSGLKDGMPLGIQLVGAEFDEARLLAAAAWCEGVMGVHLKPPGLDP